MPIGETYHGVCPHDTPRSNMMDMKTIQDWVESYMKLRIWICPYEERHDSFYKDWKSIRTDVDYQNIFNQINWNNKEGIELITGKKGSMVVSFRKDEESNYSKQSLSKVLSILGLSKDYEWVVESDYSYGIVLDVHSLPSGKITKKYRDFHLYWEDFYPLPPGMNNYRYWFTNGFPRKHPEAMAWNVFMEKLQEIDKLHLLVDEVVRAERRKNEIIGKTILGILLVVVIGVITGVFSILFNVDFDTWIWIFITTLAAAIGLIWMMSS